MDETLQKQYESAQKLLDATRKQQERRQKDNHVTRGLQILVCMLVLLEAPWGLIASICKCKATKTQQPGVVIAWDVSRLQEIARAGLQQRPTLPMEATNFNSFYTHKARKWIAEAKVTAWVVQQNEKGLAVPGSLVLEQYLTHWGIGPHGPLVVKHLAQFASPRQGKSWLLAWRRRWDLQVNPMQTSCSLKPDIIKNKARHAPKNLAAKPKTNTLCECFGMRAGAKNGCKIMCRNLEPEFVTILMCERKNHFWFSFSESVLGPNSGTTITWVTHFFKKKCGLPCSLGRCRCSWFGSPT